MRLLTKAKLFLLVLLCSFLSAAHALAYQKTIRIPLNFFIVTELSIPKGNYHLTSWIQDGDLRKTILPEVNRIWKPANIEFYERMILVRPTFDSSDKKEISDYLANAKPDVIDEMAQERVNRLSKLINFAEETSKTLNIYLVPYLGEGLHGHAQRKLRRAFISQWIEKPDEGSTAAGRFPLVEKGELKHGSMARTIAHEIGHLLKLTEPEEDQTVFHRLMGGKQPGYLLTADEIEYARKQALKLIK